MTFAQVLEYLENVPDDKKNPIERYYFDYCIVKDEDPNVDSLLLIDMEYVIYMKKALTVAENLEYNSEIECPRCGEHLHYHVSLAGIEWNHMDSQALMGLDIMFGGQMMTVRMPTVMEFMEVFKKYRLYKKVTDMRIIKLISLFEQSGMYLQKIETMVVNATYKDVAALFMLDGIYFNFVKPMHLTCSKCVEMYQPTDREIFDAKAKNNIKPEDDLPEELMYQLKLEHGGIEIGLEDVVSSFFRDINENNSLTPEEIIPRKVREDAEYRDVYD
jgi:hypothetical protein